MATETTRYLTDDTMVTVRWTATSIEEYAHTLTLGELREAVRQEGHHGPEATAEELDCELAQLEQSWLGEFEQEAGSLVEFTREIISTDGLDPVELADFTVTIAGTERYDGEAPYTYCVEARDLQEARTIVYEHHVRENELDEDCDEDDVPDVEFVEGPWDTFAGAPSWPADLPGRAWNDLRGQPRPVPKEEVEAPVLPGAPDRPGPARPKQASRGPKGPKNRWN